MRLLQRPTCLLRWTPLSRDIVKQLEEKSSTRLKRVVTGRDARERGGRSGSRLTRWGRNGEQEGGGKTEERPKRRTQRAVSMSRTRGGTREKKADETEEEGVGVSAGGGGGFRFAATGGLGRKEQWKGVR